jgi:hypothetical protein
MKVSVDNQEIFVVSDDQKNVMKHINDADHLDSILKRKLEWILMHKYEQCFERLEKEWLPKLAAKGITSVPSDRDAFAELVFSQPDYKDRSKREKESELALVPPQ